MAEFILDIADVKYLIIMDNLSERAEEILEALGIQAEEHPNKPLDLGVVRDAPACDELARLNYIRVSGEHIILTEKGKKEAEVALRRHRLAERLMTDVFDVKKKDIEGVSCKFEHLLHKGLEDSVCTLLGHPRFCPHGKPIPPGECCSKKAKKLHFLVRALSELEKNDRGKISYLHTKDARVMQKLMSMGALPGQEIKLIQKFPSYIFKIGESQFAIDASLAKSIYVRLIK